MAVVDPDELDRLRKRLEIDPHVPYDGIDCRDATIRALEQTIDRLAEERETARRIALREAAQACLDVMDSCATGSRFDKTPYRLCAATILLLKGA